MEIENKGPVATITWDLSDIEQKKDFKQFVEAREKLTESNYALNQIREYLRQNVKYRQLSIAENEIFEEVQAKFYEITEDIEYMEY